MSGHQPLSDDLLYSDGDPRIVILQFTISLRTGKHISSRMASCVRMRACTLSKVHSTFIKKIHAVEKDARAGVERFSRSYGS